MLNLFDYLTEEDNEKITAYVTKFGVPEDEYSGNEKYLTYWADNNKKLFHLLGGNLIYKVPYYCEKNPVLIQNDIRNLIEKKFEESLFEPLMKEIYSFERNMSYYILQNSSQYVENKISNTILLQKDENSKVLKLCSGTKTIKALQKVLEYSGLWEKEEIKDAFEKFRLAHSMILNDKVVKGNLCFSIHPLDFMTMSDNANNWESCMSWEHGCYRLGTVEMLNSNNVVCVYLENEKTPFIFDGIHSWNSKMWRQLFYCTKEIIMGGKSYPYQNDDITKKALDVLRGLAEKNWNNTYTFGPEPYKDMIYVGSLYRMNRNREWIVSKGQAKKHNILFDTKGMYNDMLNDQSYHTYWCVRNKVKKNTIISVSGKAPCLRCGKPVAKLCFEEEYYEGAYNDRYRNLDELCCEDCLIDLTCNYCSTIKSKKDLYPLKGSNYNKICKNCITESMKKCPVCNKIMDLYKSLHSLYSIKPYKYFVCNECFDAKQEEITKEIEKNPDKFLEKNLQSVTVEEYVSSLDVS